MDNESVINRLSVLDTVASPMRTIGFRVSAASDDAANERATVGVLGKVSSETEEVAEQARLLDKFAAVKRMRTLEAQEALARECDLSRIIEELQQRQRDAAATRLRERQTHERHTANLVRENTALRTHITALEATTSAKQAEYEAQISLFQARLEDASNLLVEERKKFKEQGLMQEESIQQLCSNLYNTQIKLGICERELTELNDTQKNLRVMTSKWTAACQERQLWTNILSEREAFFVKERDTLVEMQRYQVQQNMGHTRNMDDRYRKHIEAQASARVEAMREALEESNAMKELFLDSAALALEHKSLAARHIAQGAQLSALTQRHESLAHLFTQRTLELSASEREKAEDAAWARGLDDATIGYLLHQRDEEVRDKLSRWKDWLLEAHTLLRTLLKRYEPFQRGDEVFVQHVIQCLSSAPHLKDPVNVILP